MFIRIKHNYSVYLLMRRASAVAFSASLTGTLWARKKLIALVNTIQKFYFVDYVHQDKA